MECGPAWSWLSPRPPLCCRLDRFPSGASRDHDFPVDNLNRIRGNSKLLGRRQETRRHVVTPAMGTTGNELALKPSGCQRRPLVRTDIVDRVDRAIDVEERQAAIRYADEQARAWCEVCQSP